MTEAFNSLARSFRNALDEARGLAAEAEARQLTASTGAKSDAMVPFGQSMGASRNDGSVPGQAVLGAAVGQLNQRLTATASQVQVGGCAISLRGSANIGT